MTRLAARTLTPAAAAAAALLAGCAYTSPATTQLPYEPADGTGAAVGDVLLRNVLVVAEEEGAPGSLVGVVANRGLDDVEVQFSLTEDGTTVGSVEVPANTSVQLGPEGEEVVLDGVPAPGALLPLDVRTGQGGTQIRVQVFEPEGPYEGYAPGEQPVDGGVADPGGEEEDAPGGGDVDDEGEGSDT